MRRLVSKGDGEKKRKKNQILLVSFLALIMVLSTIGFALQGTGGSQDNGISDEAEYNGYKFTNQNGLWVLETFVFQNLPQQVPNISSESSIKLSANYQGKPAYIYSEDEGAEIEIAINLGQIAIRIQKACPENTNCTSDLPLKTCADNFIIIKESNISLINQDNNCVYITGEKEQLIALADQFLFKILGVK